MDEVEIESLKKMSKELYTQNQKLKNEIKELQEQIYGIFQQYKIVSKNVEKVLDIKKIVDELITGAKSELLIITPVIDKEYFGKLIDKVNSKVEMILVTSEMDQLKLKEDKPYKETLKAVKSNELIKSFTNPTTKVLMIMKDRERGLISTGALSNDVLNLTLNFGFLLSNKNDLNIVIRFLKLHLPRFQKLELIPVEEKKE